jgi:hypothetical protein
MTAKPRRVALYLRVSTDGQSTALQRRDLVQACEHRGWEVAEVYEDAGISGATGREGRPAFDRLCQDATRRRFDVVAAVGGSPRAQPTRPRGLPEFAQASGRGRALQVCYSEACPSLALLRGPISLSLFVSAKRHIPSWTASGHSGRPSPSSPKS